MKKFFLPFIVLLALAACGHENKPPKVSAVKFPPPVAMADMEVNSEPDEKALEEADPGVKAIKGNANADIKIDEPVGNADVKMVESDNVASSGTPSISSTKPPTRDTSKKIIKNGDISFETKDIAETRKGILAVLKKFGGYLDEDNEAIDSEQDRKEYTLKTRIPAKNFDLLLDSVSSKAVKIDSKHITISDVTTRYIDMRTRLKNRKELEVQYLSLLKKANTMTDILAVENKLNEIRTEIESTQGEFNYLNKQIAYSSLDITCYVTHLAKPYVVSNTFGHQFDRALVKGLAHLKKVFFGIIALWPAWIAGIIGFLSIRSRIRRKKRLAEVTTT